MVHRGRIRGRLPLILWFGAVGALLGVGMAGWLIAPFDLSGLTSLPAGVPAKPDEAALPPAPDAARPVAPSFDIVRVGPQGMAVFAGRALPDTQVSIRDGAREIGRTVADGHGQWVLAPDQPLAPGAKELTLAALTPSGEASVSDASVLLVIPGRGGPAATAADAPGAMAVLMPRREPPRLLQAPSGRHAALGLDLIDYDETGAIRFGGRAPAAATIRLYVDNLAQGDAVVDGDGAWTLSPGIDISPGRHMVRVDQLGRGFQVQARVEMPFEREPRPQLAASAPSGPQSAMATTAPATDLSGPHIVVQPGQTLWRIARRTYGQGMRYTVIYDANRNQIRDPAMIYPGQAFALPAQAPIEASR